jgi:hypothetical protein
VDEMTKIKYLHCVYKITVQMKNALDEVPRRGGMYNWMFLFQGDIAEYNSLTKEDLEKYDVIQVNLSPVDQLLVEEVKNKLGDSSVIIAANNDYVCEAWGRWGQHPLQYMQIQKVPDVVFGTEPYQVSQMIDGAHCIPHPHWISMLKHIGNDEYEEDMDGIGVLYHWWEGNSYTQSAVIERLRKEFPKIYSRLYGYTGQNDVCKQWQKVMFDEHMKLMDYPNFQRSIMRNKFVYENCQYHTYGRTTVDTAALRIPAVGTNRVFSMRHCYPEMCCDPMDAKKQMEIIRKVLKGGSWLDKQVDYAYDACEYFNYKNSKERYMKMIESVKK